MAKRPVPLWSVIMAGFIALGIGIFVTFIFVAVSSRDRLSDTCAVIETSRAEKRIQIRAFDESPPTTEAGRNLKDSYTQSLAAWDRLWDSLGCKGVKSNG